MTISISSFELRGKYIMGTNFQAKPDNNERPNRPMFIDPIGDLQPQVGMMGDSWFICATLEAEDREFGVLVHYIKKPTLSGTSTIAIADISTSRYLLDEAKEADYETVGQGFKVSSDNLQWSADATTMAAQGKTDAGDSFDLKLKRQGPTIAYNGTGSFPLIDNKLTTYEYGFPRMDITGSVTVNGKNYPVTGNGWFDRQWFPVADASTLASGDTRWIWISMPLSNGEVVAVWSATGKQEHSWADILHADGSHTIADVDPISENMFGIWTSSKSSINWPSGWNVTIPSVNAKLKITIDFQGQETFEGFHRIESVTHIQGTYNGEEVTGRGCGEIVGDPQIKEIY
jgi:predicted secreted hydrolase